MEVEALCDQNREAALALLERFKETSMFLLGNLAEHGPVLGAALTSGNFKCVVDGRQVVAVFSLSRNGNLILQSDRQRDYSRLILDACADEPIKLCGVIGDFALAAPLHTEHVRRCPRFHVTFNSKEDLMVLDLAAPPALAEPSSVDSGTAPALRGGAAFVRMLERGDFAEWDRLNRTFLEEDGLPIQGNREQRSQSFHLAVERKRHWGLFHRGRLCSIAKLNAHVGDACMIGGVFTMAALRRKGFSRAVMQHLMHDCHARDIRKLILFTGEHNRAARAMYDSLGFQAIGHFSLVFGQER